MKIFALDNRVELWKSDRTGMYVAIYRLINGNVNLIKSSKSHILVLKHLRKVSLISHDEMTYWIEKLSKNSEEIE